MATPFDWQSALANWSLAYGSERATASIKQQPEHFRVTEQMDVEPSGSGEHFWLWVRKREQNTEQVARQLARYAGVPYRDVGYSGLKDYYAITRQWFSVWLPGKSDLIWDDLNLQNVQIERVCRHSRKIKRGTHRANKFEIIATDLVVDHKVLNDKLNLLNSLGVPNYFGAQRFGRAANNMPQAVALLNGSRTVKDRNLRSILLSAARAWLFNTIVSARINEASWDRLMPGEPANLDGSASVFISTGGPAELERLKQLDIHPTAAMWGQVKLETIEPYRQLFDWEIEQIAPFQVLQDGLLAHKLNYQRRPIRCRISDLTWQFDQSQLMLSFELQRGQFATSVLRELLAS